MDINITNALGMLSLYPRSEFRNDDFLGLPESVDNSIKSHFG